MSERNSNQNMPNSDPIEPKRILKDSKTGKSEAERPFQYYQKLMRHDAHCKVGGRVRQRRWGG